MTSTESKVIVTPEMASEWLESSGGNRHIRRGSVGKIKAEIQAGEWKYNGDRIRFLPDGTLYDGHHRLTACMESGLPIITDTFVMDYDAKRTVDKGNPRSNADNISMELGVSPQKAKTISSAVRMMVMHDQSNVSDWGRVLGGESYGKQLSDSNIQKYYTDNAEEINDAADWAQDVVKKQNTLISKSQAVAVLCLASRVYEKESVYAIVESILTGYEIKPGTTADHVRSALVTVKMRQRKMTTQNKMYSVVKAIKSIMSGRNIKHAGNAPFRPGVDNIPRFEVTR